MNLDLLRKVTKIYTDDGVYDGSVCHEAADLIQELRMQGLADSSQCQMLLEEKIMLAKRLDAAIKENRTLSNKQRYQFGDV